MTYNYNIICDFDKSILANTLSNFVLKIYGIDCEQPTRKEEQCK